MPTFSDVSAYQPDKPEPFCSFCLRERPANVEFYKHVIESTPEMRNSLQSMLGYEFNLANFSICKPCWKMMQLIQDFRLRCCKANKVVQRVSRGLGNVEDGWFTAKNLATIENVQMAMKDQTQQIEKINVTRRILMLDDSVEEEVTGEEECSSKKMEESHQATVGQDTTADKEAKETQLEKHTCANCQKTFNTERGLKSHTFYCCLGQKLPPPDYFKEQLEKHGSIATLQCRQNCDKLFFSEPVRDHHERICGENARNLGCDTCGKRFKTRGHLRIHQWCQHSENALIYPCGVCGKMFKQQVSVRLHMRSHSKEKPFKCEFCSSKFRLKRSLKHHLGTVHAKQVAAKEADKL